MVTRTFYNIKIYFVKFFARPPDKKIFSLCYDIGTKKIKKWKEIAMIASDIAAAELLDVNAQLSAIERMRSICPPDIHDFDIFIIDRAGWKFSREEANDR